MEIKSLNDFNFVLIWQLLNVRCTVCKYILVNSTAIKILGLQSYVAAKSKEERVIGFIFQSYYALFLLIFLTTLNSKHM